jgi:hypothetical protein
MTMALGSPETSAPFTSNFPGRCVTVSGIDVWSLTFWGRMHWYRATELAASIDEYTVAGFDRIQCPYGRRVLGRSYAAQEHHNRDEKVEDGVNYYLELYWGQLGLIREEVPSFHKATASDSKLQDNELEIR